MGVSVGVAVEVAVAVAVLVAVLVPVTVAVRDGVNVAVGGWALSLVMRGAIHNAKSSWGEPFARIVRINFTLCPFKALKSILIA